jgi:hypothetical protein
VSRPTLLYYGDFSGDGSMQLVEAEFEDESLFPIRGKSCSTRAMPHLAEKFATYRDFALASLEDIYTDKCLENALRLQANTLESGVLWNDGEGKFQFEALPRIAQIAPSFGIALFDADQDGHTDIFLAQNFYGPQLETGRMDGGLGQLLLNRAGQKPKFEPLLPDQSGLVIPADATSVVARDINDDGVVDLVVATNNGPLYCFLGNRPIRSRLGFAADGSENAVLMSRSEHRRIDE